MGCETLFYRVLEAIFTFWRKNSHFFSQKRTLGLHNLRFYKKISAKVSGRLFLYAYIVVFMLVTGDYWSLLDVQMKDFHFLLFKPTFKGLSGQNRILLYMVEYLM